VLTAILGLFVLLFINRFQSEKEQLAENKPTEITKEEVNNIEFGLNKDSFHIVEARIKPNEFLANILLPHHIDYQLIDLLAKKSREIYDVRKLKAGQKYTIFKSKDSLAKARYFVYQPNPVEYVVYDLGDSIQIYTGEKEVEVKERTAGGIIHSSLYETLQEQDVAPALAVSLSEIFAWSIDFYRIQKGDWFKVIYEEKLIDGEAIGIGQILAVQFNHFEKDFYGFYFEQGEQGGDYFDEEANSLRKAFLKSPLKFSRLSSRYTSRRFHPVQKRWKAHLGTDYAAPTGTPIMSTGDGVVIAASYTGGNGNYVKVKHNSVYTTQYLHMSRRNVRNGQYVKQGDIIGYVGSTGLATGPHVCYRFWKNGKQVDHLRQEFPSAEPIGEEFKNEFLKTKKIRSGQLEEISLRSEEAIIS
jgi:murein DD-endopeptidase MepM/ murein hydrolase activator NlpD